MKPPDTADITVNTEAVFYLGLFYCRLVTHDILWFDSLEVRQIIRIDNNTIILAGHNPDTN